MDGITEEKHKVVTKEIVPQFHSERCPVCNGFGTLKYGSKTCQGCEGKGYVIVPNFKLDRKIEYGHSSNIRK